MKKLLLFCLLSVFMSMSYIANAQSPSTACCFWLENATPDQPTDLYNLNPMATSQDKVQYYYFKFKNNCGLLPNSKISIDWQISINGVPVDAITLGQLNVEIETRNPMGDLSANNGFIASGQLRSGQGFNSLLGCPIKTDYPGGLGGPNPLSYCNSSPAFTYFNLGANNLYNFYYVHFLQYASDNNLIRLKINRKSFVNDFKITVKLIERLDGQAYEDPYTSAQNLFIGGKLAKRGIELGSFTLEEQTYSEAALSACSGIPILVGIDPDGNPYSYVMSPIFPALSSQMVVDVPFYNQDGTCINYIDSIVTYTLTWASAPAVPSVANQTRCGAGTLTFTGAHPLDISNPGEYNLIYRWYSSADLTTLLFEGNSFTTPILTEDQEVSYWVTASIVSACEGLAQKVTAKAFKQPIVTLTNPTDFCPDAGSRGVIATVTNTYMPINISATWTGATQVSIVNNIINANVTVTNECNATYTYSATITDATSACTVTATKSFTLLDTIKPTFTPPANYTVVKGANCVFDITPAITGNPTNISDNCSLLTLIVSHTDVTTPGSCADNYTITRTWSVADHCGNVTTHNQIITVVDNTAPTFTVPAAITIYTDASCNYNALPAVTGNPTNVKDNCTAIPVVTYLDVNAAGTCTGSRVITRTWTVTDACSNVATATQVITVKDTIKPTFTVPANIIIYKDATCAYNASVTITGDVTDEADNCSTGLNAVFTDAVAVGSCDGNQIITRTWTLTDNCGNVTSKVQTITAVDNTAPTFTVPAAITIYTDASCNYNALPAVTGNPTNVKDNCTAIPVVTYLDVNVAGTCTGSRVITRTWTVTDACSNVATATQVITVKDTIKPTFTVPANTIIYKDATCAYNASVTITGDVTDEADNCSTGLNAVFTDAVAVGSCDGNQIITRTWTLTDNCGNVTSKVQTITAVDNTAPTFTVPAAITIYTDASCNYNALPAVTGNPTNIKDNCTATPVVTYLDVNVTETCTGSGYMTRIWTVTDACSNVATATQVITVRDTIKPTFTAPADFAVCKDAFNAFDAAPSVATSPTNLADNCTPTASLVLNHTDVVTLGTSTETGSIVRTWTLTDACGNFTSAVQTITLNASPVATLTLSTNSFCLPEDGLNVTATLAGVPGTETYTYSITLPNSTVVAANTASQLITVAGTFTFTGFVTNITTGCSSAIVEATTVALLYPDFEIFNVVNKRGCRDDVPALNGSFDVTANLNYTYTIDPILGSYTPYTFSNLPIGIYNVTATHTNGCLYTKQQAIVFDSVYTPQAKFELGGRDADTAICWTAGLYLTTLVTDLNNVFAHTYNYHIIVPTNVTALGSNGVRIEQPGIYQIGGVVENVTTGCRDTAWHYVYAMGYATVDVTAEEFCLNSNVNLATVVSPALVAPQYYSYQWTSANTGATVLGTDATLSHLTLVTNKYYAAATANYTYTGLNVYGEVLTFNLACTSKDSLTVTPLPLPEFTAIVTSMKLVCNADDPGEITINSGWDPTFTWTVTQVRTGTSFVITTPAFNVPDSGYYNITAVRINGCDYTLSNVFVALDSVGFNAILHADILPLVIGVDKSADLSFCWDNTEEKLYHEIRYTSEPHFSYMYTLLTPDNIDQINSTYSFVRAAGSYLMSGYVTNLTTGCVSNIDTLMVYAVPTPEYSISPDATICRGESIKVGIDPTTVFTTVWAQGPTTADSLLITPAIYGTNSTYNAFVTVTSSLLGTTHTCSVFDTVKITINNQPVIETPVITNVSCYGDATGSINLTVTGAIPLTYSWSNGATTEDIANLLAGNYTVTVTDVIGCTTTRTYPVTQPAPVVVNISAFENVTCFGLNNGTATVNATSSGAPIAFSYSWSTSPVQTTKKAINLAPGTYTVTVSYNTVCSATATVTITGPTAALALSTTQVDVKCHEDATGSIDLSVTGGTTPYSYLWSNGAITQDLTAIAAGTYGVTVTDKNGCTQPTSIVIAQPTAPLALSTTQVDVKCHEGNTGSIDLTVTGGTTPYSYLWSNGATTQDLTALAAGTYGVTVTDKNSCTETTSIVIAQPTAPLALSTTQVDVLCNGATTGSIDLTVTGGTPTYLYAWTPSGTTQDLTGLSAGTYSVIVTDANSCTATTSVTITQPTPLVVEITSQINANCFNTSTGEATVAATGGKAPYTYLWSNAQTSATATGLLAGIHTVTVTDANLCTSIVTVTILQPDAILLTSAAVTTPILCNGETATVTIVATGGTGAISYTFNGSTNATGIFTGITASLTPYPYSITDVNGCGPLEGAITVSQPAALTATISAQTNVACYGLSNGSATVTAGGGTGTLTYSWNTSPAQTGVTATGLAAGDYIVTVKDANGCEKTASVTITQPTAPLALSTTQVDVKCHEDATGSIDLSVTGGTPSYSYAWTPSATTQDLNNLTAGTYSVVVTDANLCTATAEVIITQPTLPLVASVVSQTNVLCYGNSTGAIDLSVTGGTGTYSYAWTPSATTQDLTGLSAGLYSVVVTDANGCTAIASTTITQPAAALTAIISTQTNVNCFGANTGSATVTAGAGTSPYTYSWNTSPVQTGVTATGLAAGTYIVTVKDANGCEQTASVTITQPTAVLAATITSQTDVLCFGNNTGVIDLTVTGGTTTYVYAWSNGAVTQDLSGLVANTYTVTVTDANACTVIASTEITQPTAALSATTSFTNVKCFGGKDGSATVDAVSGGTSPYTYAWPQTGTENDTLGLLAGTYIVTITDAHGCSITRSFTITQPTAITPSILATSPICTGTTTLVNLSVTGGTGTMSFVWSNAETTEDITVEAGTYTVTVSDGNLCTATTSVTITNHPQPIITSDEPGQVCLNTAFTVTALSDQAGTWSAQAYQARTNALVGAAVSSNVYTYTGSAVSDTIYIVYTFTSTVGPCIYTHRTNNIKMSSEPVLRIYRVAAMDNSVTINQNTPTSFHFMVDNTCGTPKGTRLAITYTILKDGVPVGNVTQYVSNDNSIRYKMPLTGTGLTGIYPDFNYTSSLSQAPAAHFPLATGTGAVLGSDQFDFFSLAFFENREGTVSINNFTEPGVYTFEFALITNYDDALLTVPHGNQIGVMTSLTPSQLGGNQFFTGSYFTKVWSTNTMTITVTPSSSPTPIEDQLISVRPAEMLPELIVYPNPSSPSQAVNVELSNFKGDAILTVTTVNGKVIERVPISVNDIQKAVVHTIYNASPGMYFITITAKETILTKKLVIQK